MTGPPLHDDFAEPVLDGRLGGSAASVEVLSRCVAGVVASFADASATFAGELASVERLPELGSAMVNGLISANARLMRSLATVAAAVADGIEEDDVRNYRGTSFDDLAAKVAEQLPVTVDR